MKTNLNFTRKLTLLTVAVASSLLMACGKSNNGSGAPNNVTPPPTDPNLYQGCATCPVGTQPLLIGVQASHSKIAMGLDFLGDPAAGPVNFADPKAIVAYRGPLVVQGNARLNNLCGASGDYSVRMLSPGVIQWGGSISGSGVGFSFPSSRMTLEAVSTTGGPTVLLQVHDGIAYNPSIGGVSRDSQTNRANLNMGVLVGGQPCPPGISTN